MTDRKDLFFSSPNIHIIYKLDFSSLMSSISVEFPVPQILFELKLEADLAARTVLYIASWETSSFFAFFFRNNLCAL